MVGVNGEESQDDKTLVGVNGEESQYDKHWQVLVLNKISKIVVVALLFMAITGSIFAYNNTANKNDPEKYLFNNKNIECLYYNTTDFINIPYYDITQNEGTIRGCIVPHHLIAKDLIHEVFQNVIKDEYKTVVLIGPDHESIDKGKIFTTLSNWQTPTGILETDSVITKELLKYDFIETNNDKLTMEHSTSSIIPFINYYLKDVKIVTLVLTKQVKLEDVDIITDALSENLDVDETLFIASIDFSHYLNLEDADKMDLISMEAIQKKDITRIMSFTNDNLDSPISIITMLKMMGKNNNAQITVLNHSNSELILKEKTEETTSYITYLFHQ
ncbi:MAG: AmmeMemoRadiSam system protein B [Sedimentibacter sp.]